MNSSVVSPFPTEVMDNIFAEVDVNDRQNLRNCAATCRAYLMLGRRRLFRAVSIALEPDTPIVNDDIKPSENVQFLSFLASDPFVPSIIHHLSFYRASIQSNISQFHWKAAAGRLQEMLPKLTCLQHVSIHSSFFLDWVRLDVQLSRILIKICHKTTLQHLELRYVGLSAREMLRFVQIPRLAFVGVYITASPSNTEDSQSMSGMQPRSVLHDLSITLRSPETAEAMSAIVVACSTSLKSLKWLSSPYHSTQDNCLHVIDLGGVPSLLDLEICFPLEDHASFIGLVDLFTRREGQSTVKFVKILCDYQHIPDPSLTSTWNWAELDAALASPVYSALQSIKIGVKENILPKHSLSIHEGSNDSNRTSQTITLFQRHLPLLHSRGLII